MHVRRSLLALFVATAAVAGAGPASAEDVTFGANNGRAGFVVTHSTTGSLTDPNSHHIDHYCNFVVAGVGNDIVIDIVATALAGPHLVAVATGVYCEVRNVNNVAVHSVSLAAPGVFVSATGPSGLLKNEGPYTVCSWGSGLWTPDSHPYQTPTRCQVPNLPIIG